MSAPMTETEFKTLAAAYGSSVYKWPCARQTRATDFINQQPVRAQAILDTQIGIDRALSQMPAQPVCSKLEAQVLDSFMQQKIATQSRLFSPLRQAFSTMFAQPANAIPAWGVTFALLLVCGFTGGYVGYAHTLRENPATELLTNTFGQDDSVFAEDFSI